MAQFLAQSLVRRPSLDAGRNGLDLVEEAMHLVREASATTLAVYYAGAIPFVLALLYFLADMSHSPFASPHLAEASLIVAVLFVGMKFAQSLFTRRLRAQLADEAMPRWRFQQSARVLLTQ